MNAANRFASRSLGMHLSLLLALLPVLWPASAQAQAVTAGSLVIEQPWARATPPGARVGGAYLTVRNTGTESDALLGGSTDVADAVEVHEMATVQGMMEMRPVDRLEIPPGQAVTFKPGGYHLMLFGLKRPLREGERIMVQLRFAKAGTVQVHLDVRSVAAGSAHGMGQGGMQGPGNMQTHGDMKGQGGGMQGHGSMQGHGGSMQGGMKKPADKQ